MVGGSLHQQGVREEQDFYLKYGKVLLFPKCVLQSHSLQHINRCYFPSKYKISQFGRLVFRVFLILRHVVTLKGWNPVHSVSQLTCTL